MRLIDADELKEKAFTLDEENGLIGRDIVTVDDIDNAPTVELLMGRMTNGFIIPIERPQGEWVMESKLYGGFGDSVLAITCSICKESFIYRGKTHNFCPNCGADMRGDKND